jgi:hypothetical protein
LNLKAFFRRFVHIALNPFFQALIVAAVIALVVPLGLQKYTVRQASMITDFYESRLVFSDLDHDGISERITTFLNNQSGNAGIAIFIGKRPVGQWNFRGIYQVQQPRTMIGDYNGNGRDEIYVFTQVNDSIMLQALEYSTKPEYFIKDRFIARLGKNLKDPDFVFYPGKVTDMTGDGSGDLVFSISAGHSRQPRSVFVYDIRVDSFQVSPFIGAFIGRMYMDNLDDDPYDEILLSTYASSNYNAEPVAYSDTSSWLMVLDHDLSFMFPPAEFPGASGGTQIVSIDSGNGGKIILGKVVYGSVTQVRGKFFTCSSRGDFISEKELEIEDPLLDIGLVQNPKGRSSRKALAMHENVGFYEVDEKLKVKQVSDIIFSGRIPQVLDIDQDGMEEMIVVDKDHKQHLVLRNDFSNPVVIDFPVQSTVPIFSIKLNSAEPPQLSVQGDREWKLFDYGINPAYRFRFLIYLAIYLFLLGFIMIIRKLYSIQLKKRYETERKITTLQLSSIKAQMEPHFVFNVINSIGSSIYRERKDEAYQLVVRFSNMVRSLLSSSDLLIRTLREETDFVSNFLELEKIRFPELFSYTISIGEEVDTDSMVPKMIIQLHAENALKHGIRPKGFEGMLEIRVVKDHDCMKISIRDNGVGREDSGLPKADSTGKGMKLLGQLFETYNKYNKLPIRQEITDLYDEAKKPAGTLVEIWVPLEFNERIY